MGFFSDSDKWGRGKRELPPELEPGGPGEPGSDKSTDKDFPGNLQLDLDEDILSEDLRGYQISPPTRDGKVRMFGKYTREDIENQLQWSGVTDAIRDKGYTNTELELNYLSELDQRIFVREAGEVLIHIRLKLSHFRFRLQPAAPRIKLLYIDWLLTQHPRSQNYRPERLFPGQELPGLGIFAQLTEFIRNLAMGVGARGAFNIPEYFHDAMLFHRQFNFYDPLREAFFRGIIRDLRRHGAREISHAFADRRIFNQNGEALDWKPGEMISIVTPRLADQIWSPDYYTRVVRELKRIRFRLTERPPEDARDADAPDGADDNAETPASSDD
ncbi:MAG: hypothetical protein NXI24_04065 [bacterium]|nr:hypothetical protein [bacterium]